MTALQDYFVRWMSDDEDVSGVKLFDAQMTAEPHVGAEAIIDSITIRVLHQLGECVTHQEQMLVLGAALVASMAIGYDLRQSLYDDAVREEG